jgi:hypothetical protein
MEAVLRLSFRSDGNSTQYTKAGWGNPEPHGTWTMASTATLVLSPVLPGKRYRVTITLRPYLFGDKLKSQILRILCNDVLGFSDAIAEGTTISFDIPAEAVNASRKLAFTFEIPNSTAPASLSESRDIRQLGFAVASLSLDATGPAPLLTKSIISAPKKIAAVTMVYNEAEYLPIWLRHYGRQVGPENCYVIDHGSSDGSTRNLGLCNVIRIPRSPYDPTQQSVFNSQFCSSLLNWFDWVVYSDVDELLMADPLVAPSLSEYVRRPLPDVVTAIGLNVAHRVDVEADLDFAKAITAQRSYVFSSSSMCKPNLISRPITWSPGSHSSDAEVIFDHLYLFHLRWVDLPYGLRRLQKTRAMDWARTNAGQHQRVEDERMTRTFNGFGRLPPRTEGEFSPHADPIKGYIDAVLASQIGRENQTYKITLDMWGQELWKIPDRFFGSF